MSAVTNLAQPDGPPCRPQGDFPSGAVTVGAVTITVQATSYPDRHDTQASGDFYLATNGGFHLGTDSFCAGQAKRQTFS
jgi:hypothetical protein